MGLLDIIHGLSEAPGKAGKAGNGAGKPEGAADELFATVDGIVRASNPMTAGLRRYRKTLTSAVECTRRYSDVLTSKVPGPVEIDRDSWSKDPLVKALFATAGQFEDFFFRTKELKEIFEKNRAEHCFALLTATREEKTVFTTDKEGEILKQNVPKTAVSFDEHRLVAPTPSLEKTQRELSKRTVAVLTDFVCEDLVYLKKWKKELEDERRLLEAQIKFREARDRNVNLLFSGRKEDHGPIGEAKKVLESMDGKISEVSKEISGPEDYLSKVAGVLSNPEKYLQIEPVVIRMGDLGLKSTDPSDPKAKEIRFAELSLQTGLKRAAVLVQCSNIGYR